MAKYPAAVEKTAPTRYVKRSDHSTPAETALNSFITVASRRYGTERRNENFMAKSLLNPLVKPAAIVVPVL